MTPLAIYNFVCFDRLGNLPSETYDPEKPPQSTVVISLGTDTTDLVVTNGFRVWQRNIPLGGNHFTQALTKELKLTFAKAEHLKRNATRGRRPEGRLPGDAAGVQRSAHRNPAFDRLFHEHRQVGQDRRA